MERSVPGGLLFRPRRRKRVGCQGSSLPPRECRRAFLEALFAYLPCGFNSWLYRGCGPKRQVAARKTAALHEKPTCPKRPPHGTRSTHRKLLYRVPDSVLFISAFIYVHKWRRLQRSRSSVRGVHRHLLRTHGAESDEPEREPLPDRNKPPSTSIGLEVRALPPCSKPEKSPS